MLLVKKVARHLGLEVKAEVPQRRRDVRRAGAGAGTRAGAARVAAARVGVATLVSSDSLSLLPAATSASAALALSSLGRVLDVRILPHLLRLAPRLRQLRRYSVPRRPGRRRRALRLAQCFLRPEQLAARRLGAGGVCGGPLRHEESL